MLRNRTHLPFAHRLVSAQAAAVSPSSRLASVPALSAQRRPLQCLSRTRRPPRLLHRRTPRSSRSSARAATRTPPRRPASLRVRARRSIWRADAALSAAVPAPTPTSDHRASVAPAPAPAAAAPASAAAPALSSSAGAPSDVSSASRAAEKKTANSQTANTSPLLVAQVQAHYQVSGWGAGKPAPMEAPEPKQRSCVDSCVIS